MNEFNPREGNREPREEGWKDETERFYELLNQRGDMRIGQLIVNAVTDSKRYNPPERELTEEEKEEMSSEEILEYNQRTTEKRKALLEQMIWNLEAPELNRMIEQFLDKHDFLDEE